MALFPRELTWSSAVLRPTHGIINYHIQPWRLRIGHTPTISAHRNQWIQHRQWYNVSGKNIKHRKPSKYESPRAIPGHNKISKRNQWIVWSHHTTKYCTNHNLKHKVIRWEIFTTTKRSTSPQKHVKCTTHSFKQTGHNKPNEYARRHPNVSAALNTTGNTVLYSNTNSTPKTNNMQNIY